MTIPYELCDSTFNIKWNSIEVKYLGDQQVLCLFEDPIKNKKLLRIYNGKECIWSKAYHLSIIKNPSLSSACSNGSDIIITGNQKDGKIVAVKLSQTSEGSTEKVILNEIHKVYAHPNWSHWIAVIDNNNICILDVTDSLNQCLEYIKLPKHAKTDSLFMLPNKLLIGKIADNKNIKFWIKSPFTHNLEKFTINKKYLAYDLLMQDCLFKFQSNYWAIENFEIVYSDNVGEKILLEITFTSILNESFRKLYILNTTSLKFHSLNNLNSINSLNNRVKTNSLLISADQQIYFFNSKKSFIPFNIKSQNVIPFINPEIPQNYNNLPIFYTIQKDSRTLFSLDQNNVDKKYSLDSLLKNYQLEESYPNGYNLSSIQFVGDEAYISIYKNSKEKYTFPKLAIKRYVKDKSDRQKSNLFDCFTSNFEETWPFSLLIFKQIN